MFNITKNKGFSLIEYIIALILIGAVMATLFSLTVGGLKNGRFVQKLADVKVLASQKATELFNDIPKQVKNISLGQTTVGSIDPNAPAQGYFDLLNESGCVVSRSILPPGGGGGKGDPPGGGGKDDPPGGGPKGGSGGSKGIVASDNANAKGDVEIPIGGTGIGKDIPDQNAIDCSNATVAEPTNSTVAKYRRQWLIAKNKPNIGDTTVYVVIVYQDTNVLARSMSLIKVDGTSSKASD